jgi:tripartite-type tricarboxylate transporter receptor subunit TctC
MKTFLAIVSVASALCAAPPLHAQTFPDRPVKVIVAYPPGGPTDTIARIATQGIVEQLGQNMFIENIAGAGGRIGARDVARAAPDGYTLLLGGSNDNTIAPVLYKNLDYDPIKDFVPVSAVATDSNAIVVNPEVPVHTLAELVSYTKANPGKLTSGATLGIAPHLMLEFIRVRTGADMVFVPYKGAAPAIADVLGNHIQVNASAKSVLLPLIKDGKLRALAVSSAERWPELPDVPTLRESGLDGFPTAVWFVLMAPAGTPPAVITRLNEAVNLHILSKPIREGIRNIGLEPHVLAQDVLAKVIADETQLWQGVARETGVHLE